MSAFVLGHIRIEDEVAWQRYRDRVVDTIESYDGEVVFRGRRAEVFAGRSQAELIVIIRFPSARSARLWHDSDDYQALVPLREQAARVDLVLYEV